VCLESYRGQRVIEGSLLTSTKLIVLVVAVVKIGLSRTGFILHYTPEYLVPAKVHTEQHICSAHLVIFSPHSLIAELMNDKQIIETQINRIIMSET
jgi:hypothetical protein